MTSAEDYINSVLENMPRWQLGNPERLAESYLSAVPRVSTSFGRRAAAKIVDVLVVLAVVAIVAVAWRWATSDAFVALLIEIFGSSILFGLYTMVAESQYSQTLGKRLVGLRVVRESGARISVAQPIVRQLPMFLQIYWIDVLFALFTDKSQRAFELLSKTRVVRVAPQEVR